MMGTLMVLKKCFEKSCLFINIADTYSKSISFFQFIFDSVTGCITE